jgi:ketosteroid isomerase-like protein
VWAALWTTGVQAKGDVVPEPSLNDVTVRQFGDTAILTGILTNKTGRETTKGGTTVVFVRRGGTWLIASVQWSPEAGGK